ncbi:LPXTG-motif cell wall anchor domain-containing protein/fimbrial isopeptide formation D2 domain-containing protein [Enterococcus malodoratus]|uniref:SpaH/EbpB family LPXTG-anchored major pilin n=1 Tax=Enterococcus malodoratus TaxID=71451 RepID=UPI0008D26440|nr:SpaH/EbpB family LPXTG-anchored major pilin [Enterococcus malodoratus]SES96271.1 LPXTG-motif cell wall anchor domain-containing protein/fimbrial isopeptide formation D2 domain-containing protein [Enterococcus malodoratus]
MKNKLSKIVAVLLMLATTLGGAVTGFAAPGSRPASGDLTIHKHYAEDASQIGNEGDGTEQTISNPAVSGVHFNVYTLTAQTGAPAIPPSEKEGAVYRKVSNTELEIDYKGNTYTYTMAALSGSGKTAADGTLKFTDLNGYYYVEEDLSSSTPKIGEAEVSITVSVKPFIVSVPMTNASGDGWITDVHVYPKNQGTTPTKTIGETGDTNIVEGSTGNSVKVGDSFPFTIRTNIPADIDDNLASDPNTKKYSKFELWDSFDDALTYNNDVGVYAYKKALDGTWSRQQILPNDDSLYMINYTAPKLTVSFTESGRTKLAELMNGKDKWSHVGIHFTTTVNENIHEKINNTVENKATVTFENEGGSGGDKNTETPPTETNTGDIDINKTERDGTTPLTGAEFQLADTKGNAEAGNFLKVKVDGNGKITEILPHDSNDPDAKNWVIRPHETDTNRLGVIGDTFYAVKFEGLQTESGSPVEKNKYYIAETKAPKDYNLLDEVVEVDFAKEDSSTHIVLETIKNSKGFTLPNTGGVGTLLLVVFGIVLIGLAIILTMNKKKKTV